MKSSPRRQKGNYFPSDTTAPPPLVMRLQHVIRFSDVDPMGILWHGRYAKLFEQANEELGRACGMSYPDFRREKIAAPIVQLHVDYFAPVSLGEKVGILGRMLWCEGARINIEYEIHRANAALAATGYTVQMFVDETGAALLASPPLLDACRRRWKSNELDNLK